MLEKIGRAFRFDTSKIKQEDSPWLLLVCLIPVFGIIIYYFKAKSNYETKLFIMMGCLLFNIILNMIFSIFS